MVKVISRKQKAYVNLPGHSSSVKTITCNVPQVSTLDPLIFLPYINDLQSVFSESVVNHFAYDTNVLFLAKNLGTIESVINHEIKLLVQWLRSNKLSLNETKTELIIFRSPWKHLPCEPDIRNITSSTQVYLLMKCCPRMSKKIISVQSLCSFEITSF